MYSLLRAFGKYTNCQHVKYLPFGDAEVPHFISATPQCEQTIVCSVHGLYILHISYSKMGLR